MIDCQSDQATVDGPAALRPLRARPRTHLLRARGPRGLRCRRLPWVLDGVLRRPLRPAGSGARRGGHRDLLQLRRIARRRVRSPRRGSSPHPATHCGCARLGRGGTAPVRRDRRRRRRDRRASCWRRRRAAPRSTAARCSPPTWRCRGPTSRWPRCGTRRRCCANSAATPTSLSLDAFGVSGRDCNVLHSVADRVPRDFIMRSRQYDDDEWLPCTGRLGGARRARRRRRTDRCGHRAQTAHRGHHRSSGVGRVRRPRRRRAGDCCSAP